ncbi:Aste57867_9081 [Aphanomyces stellatus]|uniref:Aste57867_9081 protein n=1 Tax=Aphanomyces stellatus TaxID=120398 RepID=A0A485KM63_9STRA|nr:hypothetical protein As57867_009045 [Aphanomyces stellatus]VFT85965.1 Aste57867_9081 [Aphanomyces stellatus]
MSAENAPLAQELPSYQNQQPATAMPVTAAVGVPVVLHAVQGPAWKTGIFGCFSSFPNTLMSLFCQCIVLAQVSSRLGNVFGGYKGVLAGVFVIASLAGVFRLYAQHDWNLILAHGRPVDEFLQDEATKFNEAAIFMTLVLVTFVAWLRGRVRGFFSIPGSVVEDCCCSLLCHCCTVAQMSNQVAVYAPGDCNPGPRDTLPAYYVAVPLQ